VSADGASLARGLELLEAGDWTAAKSALEGAGDSPGALAALGEAVFWLGDLPHAIELRQRAYLGFRERGELAPAARLALWLAAEHTGALGNAAVGSGWLGRAERVIDELGECRERGWLMLRHSRNASEPTVAEQRARDALAIAQAFADRDLEIAAISQLGRVHLAAGRTDAGFAHLDEAMAAATAGEVRSRETVSDTCCDMIVACERTMAIERATQWCQVTEDYARRYQFQPLFAFCRVTYAGVLIAIGRWADAERELGEALRSYEASLAQKSFLALGKLAELRLLQGRDAEAEELIAEHLHHPALAKVVAQLQLARGDVAGAIGVLERRLGAVEHDVLVAAPLLGVLVEAQVAAGAHAAAAASASRLGEIATITRCSVFVAAAAFASGLAGARDPVAALEAAIHGFDSIGLPLPAARARIALARVLAERDEPAAKELCRRAVAAFDELGARRDLDSAAELRRQLGAGAKLGPRTSATLTRREDEVLALLALGLSNAKIGARLFISPKTVEHHVGHILAKLGLETRAAAAAYAAKHAKKPGVK